MWPQERPTGEEQDEYNSYSLLLADAPGLWTDPQRHPVQYLLAEEEWVQACYCRVFIVWDDGREMSWVAKVGGPGER